MNSPPLEILSPGLLTTVQDRGRYGYQRFGVPVSGAMDEFALRAANLLVGNDQGAACLEMTVLGPTARFLRDARIAVTGGDLTGTLNGAPLPRWQPVDVAKDSELSFRNMQDGMRAYLAIAGGIDVPVVMGSRSTYLPSGIGGFDGRALAAGDVVSAFPTGSDAPARRLPRGYDPPVYGAHHDVRVVMGPQADAFGQDAVDVLLGSTFTISLDSDRMGYRLEGAEVRHATGPDIVSDGNPPGAIQVPGSGVPTVLLADRGTTGGYTKIATVIAADLGKLAQAVPAQTVSLTAVDQEEAAAAAREQESVLAAIALGIDDRVTVAVDGRPVEVVDAAGGALTSLGTVDAGANVVTASVESGGQTYELDVEVARRGWSG